MTKDEVIAELSTYTGRFPRRAVETAREIWSELADDMLAALEHAAASPREIADDEDAMLHTYAMYLCAEKRDTRALEPVLRMMSYPDRWALDALFGDILTEAGGRIIASLYAGDLRPIRQLIENRELHEYSRGQGILALPVLVAAGHLEREDVIAYLRELLEERIEREPSNVWHDAVDAAAVLAADELKPAIEKAYEEELVEYIFDTPETIFAELAEDVDTAMERLRTTPNRKLIEDTVAEMEWWAAFRNENEGASARRGGRSFPGASSGPMPAFDAETAERLGGTVRREQPKIGRNEPCPCGSGRKYKKCCGR